MASSSQRPAATDMPRRVSFGKTPVPERPANTRQSTKTSSPEHHQQFVPAEKIKTMSDLDKEEEARLAKSYKEKAINRVAGVMDWLGNKIKGGGLKKV